MCRVLKTNLDLKRIEIETLIDIENIIDKVEYNEQLRNYI